MHYPQQHEHEPRRQIHSISRTLQMGCGPHAEWPSSLSAVAIDTLRRCVRREWGASSFTMPFCDARSLVHGAAAAPLPCSSQRSGSLHRALTTAFPVARQGARIHPLTAGDVSCSWSGQRVRPCLADLAFHIANCGPSGRCVYHHESCSHLGAGGGTSTRALSIKRLSTSSVVFSSHRVPNKPQT